MVSVFCLKICYVEQDIAEIDRHAAIDVHRRALADERYHETL